MAFVDGCVKAGNVAVVTGASSGIGRAMAARFVKLGMTVYAADIDAAELEKAAAAMGAIAVPTDVADPASVERLAEKVYSEAGKCNVLVNNAGIGGGGGPLAPLEKVRKTLAVNTFGPIHGCQAFVPRMKESKEPGLVVNTGSKQGITCPPGNTAYNMSKAALKVYTEALEHDLRTSTDHVKAALLIPGWVNTSIVLKAQRDAALADGKDFDANNVFFHEDKPAKGAWMPDQVVDFMLAELKLGRFYIVCPDNEVSRTVDNARMTWAMMDITRDRPPLSRWHPDYKAPFNDFLSSFSEADD